jgi:aminoglycoside phosphotransferase (APT) family kinase protein
MKGTETGRHPNQRELASLPVELRRTTVPEGVQEWIRTVTGRPVARVRRLPGASSTAVHGVWLEGGDRFVLRRYLWSQYLAEEPEAPAREVDALRFAHAHGLPVPEVVAADLGGEATGEGRPALLMTFLPGQALAVPDLHDLAEVAASIHAVPGGPPGHDWFRWYGGNVQVPPSARRPELWEVAIDRWTGDLPSFTPALTHRDFHPGNVLWARGRATGIVDWANACRGPWGCDVAHCRWNLMELSGVEAADRFLASYEAVSGATYDPFWELGSVLEHGPSMWEDTIDVVKAERRLALALDALG